MADDTYGLARGLVCDKDEAGMGTMVMKSGVNWVSKYYPDYPVYPD